MQPFSSAYRTGADSRANRPAGTACFPCTSVLAISSLALRGYTAIGKGVRLPERHQPDERVARLSERERDILAFGTVKNYVTQILSALGVRHRTQAALLWRNAEQLR